MLKRVLFKLLLVLCFLGCFLISDSSAWADDNKIGIHILEPRDLDKAAQLVNSNGGDWGYITVVIREDDLNREKWQKFFDDCRRLHLIPIVRLATEMMSGDAWVKPKLEDLEKWPQFLNSLNWPVKQQIVTVFNEPNHAKEWGGEINPQEYALVLDRLTSSFKRANPNFFILNAGYDQAAGMSRETMDETVFLQKMVKEVPGIFNKLDGWASHSYPNYGFVGLPEDIGRATIRGYEWELRILRSLGLDKELPVYITETGWPHREGLEDNPQFYPAEEVAEFMEKVFRVWKEDSRVQAVTPFILDFSLSPFDHFSWLDQEGNQYPQFDRVLGMSKNKAEPEQIQSYEVVKVFLADLLPTNYSYRCKVVIKNTGQWIIGERSDFRLTLEQPDPRLRLSEIKLPRGKLIYPGEEKVLDFTLKTGTQSAEHKVEIGGSEYSIYVFKPWSLRNQKVSLWRQILARLKLWWWDFTKS